MEFDAQVGIEIRNSLRDGRPVVLLGPRRGGLTHWTRSTLRGLGYEFLVVDLKEPIHGLRKRTTERGLHPEGDADLSSAFREHFDRKGAEPVLFSNCHRADRALLVRILAAVCDPLPGAEVHGGIIIEGALDFDSLLAHSFPNGLPSHPLVFHAEPPTPWGRIGEAERVIRSRRPAAPASVIAALCDLTGGDLVLLGDLLESLPSQAERMGAASIKRAMDRASRGGASADILRSLPLPETAEAVVLGKLAAGAIVPGDAPDVLESGPLKELYLLGLASFEHTMSAYRIGGPLTASIVGKGLGCSSVSPDSFVQSRAAYLLSITAGVELDIRALVGALPPAYADVKAALPTPQVVKNIKAAIAGGQLDPDAKQSVLATVGDPRHTDQTVLEAARFRSKDPNCNPLDWITFNELLGVAHEAGVLPKELRPIADRLVARRNDVAHLRATSSEEMDAVRDDALDLIRGLKR